MLEDVVLVKALEIWKSLWLVLWLWPSGFDWFLAKDKALRMARTVTVM